MLENKTERLVKKGDIFQKFGCQFQVKKILNDGSLKLKSLSSGVTLGSSWTEGELINYGYERGGGAR